MAQSRMLLLWGSLICTAAFLINLNGCGGGSGNSSTNTPPPTQKVQHIVVIFQENRSTDNLFQDPVLVKRGADIQTPAHGWNKEGTLITPTAASLGALFDPDHTHASFLAMYDNGKMDGADKITVSCPQGCPPNPTFTYVDNSTGDVAPYYALAETYTFGDRMFQTNQGPSFPAHQFIISGTSAPVPPGGAMSQFFVAENPGLLTQDDHTGCTAPPTETVLLIDSTNPNPKTNETQKIYTCFDHPTLTDLLNAKQISWKYYAPVPGSIWTGPNAIEHMCGPAHSTACTASDWVNNVVLNYTQVLTDIGSGQLADVSWVIPTGTVSDHAGLTNGTGPSWVASVVNAIGTSPYWANTAIIITWDDWGGWYDHVTPASPTGPGILNSDEFGFRVPLIVVSPYAKPAYISHQVNDFGSILKFIESTFGLAQVAPGASTPYADTFTMTGDLSDCFDFTQTPLTFQTIPAKFDAAYFLNDKSAPTGPDND
jgi:phospholipase C